MRVILHLKNTSQMRNYLNFSFLRSKFHIELFYINQLFEMYRIVSKKYLLDLYLVPEVYEQVNAASLDSSHLKEHVLMSISCYKPETSLDRDGTGINAVK